jgi:hypothetical protein
MREFKSLNPEGLPDGFDVSKHTESPIVKVDQTQNQIVISFAFPGFYLVEDPAMLKDKRVEFRRPHISSVGFFAQSGRPLLPAFSRYVHIPPNSKLESISVEKEQMVQFDNVLVAPAQEKLADSFSMEHEFEYDEEFYKTDEFYPKEVAELRGPLVIEGFNAYLLSVRPLQYNPAKKKLVGYGNITVTIKFSLGGEGRQPEATNARIGNTAVDNLFLNPALFAGIFARATAWAWIFAPTFLIIYNDAFKAAADKLALWKKQCGLKTSTVPISTIGNDVDQIKAYIRARTPPLHGNVRYVLLLGDTDTIATQSYTPWLYATYHGQFISHRDTDFYYATSTNKEDPKPAGAPGYILPKIAIGRIPAANPTQALAIVDKIIAYEKTPPTNQSYYNNLTLAAYFQDGQYGVYDGQEDRAFVETIQGIYDFFATDPKYNLERVYVSNNNGNENFYHSGASIPASVKAAFTASASTATTALKNATANGRHFIAHRDHGDIPGWEHPKLTTTELAIVNSAVPSIFYSINCLTGAFGEKGPRFSSSTDGFAEALLKMLTGGAPSVIAASDLSHTWLNNDLILALFDAMYGGMLPTFPGMAESYPVQNNRIGDILNYAKYYLPIGRSGGASDDDIVVEFEEYHVIGDPTLEIWTDLPKKIKLTAIWKPFVLQISMSACPPGSRITIWKGNTLLKTISPTTTTFTLSARGGVVGEGGELISWPTMRKKLFVCFKAPGYAFTKAPVKGLPLP